MTSLSPPGPKREPPGSNKSLRSSYLKLKLKDCPSPIYHRGLIFACRLWRQSYLKLRRRPIADFWRPICLWMRSFSHQKQSMFTLGEMAATAAGACITITFTQTNFSMTALIRYPISVRCLSRRALTIWENIITTGLPRTAGHSGRFGRIFAAGGRRVICPMSILFISRIWKMIWPERWRKWENSLATMSMV